MERVARTGHAENGRGLASGRFSPLLEMALTSQTSGRQNEGQQGGPSLDLPDGG